MKDELLQGCFSLTTENRKIVAAELTKAACLTMERSNLTPEEAAARAVETYKAVWARLKEEGDKPEAKGKVSFASI